MTQKNETIVFSTSLLEEATELLYDAQEYFEYLSMDEKIEHHPRTWLQYSTEMSRVTLRLSSIIAWLGARRAVTAGALTTEEAEREYRLKGRLIGSMHDEESTRSLPPHLQHLLRESHRLFMRVLHIENQEYGEMDAEEMASMMQAEAPSAFPPLNG